MKQEMTVLLHHLQQSKYTTEDVVTIMEGLKKYGKAIIKYNKSKTREGEAVARRVLNEARTNWHKVVKTYDLPIIEPEKLY